MSAGMYGAGQAGSAGQPIFTDDVSLQVFMEHLKRLVSLDEYRLPLTLPTRFHLGRWGSDELGGCFFYPGTSLRRSWMFVCYRPRVFSTLYTHL